MSETILKARTVKRLFNISLFIDILLQYSKIWLYGISGLLVSVKLLSFQAYINFNYLFATSMLILVFAIKRYMESSYNIKDAAAWLDLKEEGGGTIIASVWQNSEPNPSYNTKKSINININPVTHIKTIGLPLIIFIVSIIIPGIKSKVEASPAAIQKKLKIIEKNLEELEYNEVLSAEKMEKLQDAFDKAALGLNKKSEIAMEGVDHIQDSIDQEILEKARREVENLRMAEDTLSKLLSESKSPDSASGATKEQLEKVAEAVKKLSENALESNPDMQKLLNKMNCKSCKNVSSQSLSSLSESELKKLAECLRKCSKKQLAKCKSCQSCMGNALSKKDLEKLFAGIGSLSELKEKIGSSLKEIKHLGNGGVGRGRADAPMAYGKKKHLNNAQFKPVMVNNENGIIPGQIIDRKGVKAEEIIAEEFQNTERSGIIVNGKVVSMESASSLGPARKAVAEKYFEAITSNK